MRNIKLIIASLLLASQLFAIKVIDATGRSVEVGEVKKVVALSSTLRFLTYLGASDMVVATEAIEKRDIESRPYTLATHKKSALLPVVGEGGAGKPTDFEKIVALKPDVVFTAFIDAASAEAIQKKINTPVVVLSYGQNGFDNTVFATSLRCAASIMGKTKRAEELINYMKSLDARLDSYAKAAKIKPKVYISGVAYKGQHGICSTEANFFGFKKLGLINISDSSGKSGHLFIDKEFILKNAPSVLYVDGGGYGNIAEEYAKEPKFFELISAVRNGHTYMSLPNVFYASNVEVMYANAFFYAATALGAKLDIQTTASEIFTKFVFIDAYPVMKTKYGGYSKLKFSGAKIVKEGY